MKKVLLKIGGMTCSACSSGLEKYLNKQEGVKASVNLVMNNALVEYDDEKLKVADIEKFISKAGFESLGIDKFEKEEKKKSKEKGKLIFLTIISLVILYISMSHMVGLPQIPFLSMHEYPLNYAISLFILTLITLFIEKDILRNGYKNLIHKTPNMDTLVLIGVTASMIYLVIKYQKEGILCAISLVGSAAIVIFFIKIGKYVEGENKAKTKEALQELMTITPSSAIILKDGKEQEVTIDQIKKGDIVVCKPGQKIAVDGVIIKGTTHIDESFITGESIPVKREEGSKVIAGSINYEGAIEYEAEKIGKDSTVSEIVRMVAQATNTKAPISRIADKISGIFVPFVIVLALITFAIWCIISKDISVALNYFVTILVVACPCSLGLATPLAIVIASGICTKRGILVKSSEALENAHKVKSIVLDKTGTITKGKLNVSKIYNYSNIEENDILQDIASIENKSEHPIARAIVNEAENRKLTLKGVKEFKALSGLGVTGIVDENKYVIGNLKLMNENNITVNNDKDFNSLINDGNSVLFVGRNEELVALLGVKDTLKENIKDVISSIKAKGIDVIMLTGDNEKTANVVAKEASIEKVIANVLPSQKADVVKELKKDGIVMMCGDGINDSVSLVTADIGVSVSSGTDIAMDSSDVVIMNDNLDRINDLILISKKTITNIKQNLFWAFAYNICMIPIAMGIFTKFNIVMNPMFGSMAMTLSSLTVVLNALRLKNIKFKKH